MELFNGALAGAVEAALDKKASEVVVLDLRELGAFTDFFLLCTGGSTPQIQAIADEIERRLLERGRPMDHREGYEAAEWVLHAASRWPFPGRPARPDDAPAGDARSDAPERVARPPRRLSGPPAEVLHGHRARAALTPGARPPGAGAGSGARPARRRWPDVQLRAVCAVAGQPARPRRPRGRLSLRGCRRCSAGLAAGG